MGMDGGGKLPCSHDAKLVKSFSRVEPRKFGIGLVAGFLLVTCAYFSTAKFDAIHIAMLNPSGENAAGIGSLVKAADGSGQQLDLGLQDRDALSRQGSKAEVLDDDDDNEVSPSGPADSGRNASLEDTRKGAALVGGGGDASVSVASAAVGSRGEARAKEDDATGGAAGLPPVSSEEPANSTQESGVLEDEELQVQDAIANATRKSNDSSSSNAVSHSVVPSDPAVFPAPVQQVPLPSSEVKAPAGQQTPPVPEIKQADSGTLVRERKPLCDVTTNRRIDWCELDGDVRVLGTNGTVSLVAAPGADSRTFREESWRIQPYPRKADPNAMRHIRALTVRSVSGDAAACTDRHDVPALVFSDRGYVGNYFHAFTDVILPLFLTARQYGGEVRLLVTNFQMWFLGKFMPVFKAISNYELMDLDHDPRVHCFPHVQVGLTSHSDFSIDPARAPNGYSMLDFTKFMRTVYGLSRDAAGKGPRPRLLVILRARTRRFVNADEIVRGVEKLGFEVVVSEGMHEVAPFAEIANSCDAIMGVHGAGLTNMVFLPPGGVVIQIVPLGGLEFVANYFRGPSRDMGHRYLEYRIKPEESTLVDEFPRDHPIFTDPEKVKSKGWNSLKDAYLDKQDVRLDMKRFRPTLKKAIAHFRKGKADGDN